MKKGKGLKRQEWRDKIRNAKDLVVKNKEKVIAILATILTITTLSMVAVLNNSRKNSQSKMTPELAKAMRSSGRNRKCSIRRFLFA